MRATILIVDTARSWQGWLLAEAFRACFVRLGFETDIVNNVDRSCGKGILFVMSCKSLSGLGNRRWDGPIILYNVAEAYIFPARWKRCMENCCGGERHLDFIFDYSPMNKEKFSAWGYRVIFVPVGYHQMFEKPLTGEPIYDLSFLGGGQWGKARRLPLFDRLKREPGLKFFHNDCRARHGYWRDNQTNGVWNNEAISTKIFLHTRRMGDKRSNFASLRIVMLGMANRLCMLAERSDWLPECFDHGKNILIYEKDDYDGLVALARTYIESDDWRRVGNAGYETIVDGYRLFDHLQEGLQEAKLL